MKLQGLFTAAALALAVSLPHTASATNAPIEELLLQETSGVLHTKPKWNRDLESGDYAFAATHKPSHAGFFDSWKFTLAEDSNVTISLVDVEVPLTSDALVGALYCGDEGKDKLFDNKFLTFSLFDQGGNLLGSAGEGGTLSALNLLAGQWYTLTVSAKVDGIFGSAYHGNVNVEAVPLSDTLPLFGSALVLLAVRARKKAAAKA